MEMCAPEYVIGMTSVMDTEEGLLRLEKALWELDQELDTEPVSYTHLPVLGSRRKREGKGNVQYGASAFCGCGGAVYDPDLDLSRTCLLYTSRCV